MGTCLSTLPGRGRVDLQDRTSVGLSLLLFVAVYAPASALAAGLHLQLATAIPFVMLFTLVTAGFFIRVLAGHSPGGRPNTEFAYRR